jgi:hypothetical protein
MFLRPPRLLPRPQRQPTTGYEETWPDDLGSTEQNETIILIFFIKSTR